MASEALLTGGAANLDRAELRRGIEGAGMATADHDAFQNGFHPHRVELPSDLALGAAATDAEFNLGCQVVELHHDPVDPEWQAIPFSGNAAEIGNSLVGRGAVLMGDDIEAEFCQSGQLGGFSIERNRLPVTGSVEIEGKDGQAVGLVSVLAPHDAGAGIARILAACRIDAAPVLNGEDDLEAHSPAEAARTIARPGRQSLETEGVGGNVLANHPIAPRDGLHESAILVIGRRAGPVALQGSAWMALPGHLAAQVMNSASELTLFWLPIGDLVARLGQRGVSPGTGAPTKARTGSSGASWRSSFLERVVLGVAHDGFVAVVIGVLGLEDQVAEVAGAGHGVIR